jgi:hypothetical protein
MVVSRKRRKAMFQARRGALVCLLATAVALAGAGAQSIFLPGTPPVDTLVALFQDAGMAFPTSSFPVSKAELARFADALALRAPAELRQAIQDYRDVTLRDDRTHDRVSALGNASFLYTYRSQDVPFDPGLPPELQTLDIQRLFLEAPALAGFGFDYSRDSGFEMGILARVQREYFEEPFNPTNLWESAPPGNPVALENQFVYRGFLWYDFHPLQVELGRDKVQMGPVESSLLLSTRLPYLDVLRLRLPVGRLTGDLVISTLENRKSAYDVTATGGLDDPNFGPTVILLAVHRWEYAFDTLRLGIAGRCVYARSGNSFSLGDVFPVFSWHQADLGSNNMCLDIDATWAPLPRLVLTGQLGLDDIDLNGTGFGADSGVPTIPAAIVTADYRLPVAKGLGVDFSFEAGYTHYLWGNFSLDTPANVDALARAIDRYRLDGGIALLPLTSPYGPGALWFELTTSLKGLPWLDASVSVRYFQRMTNPADEGLGAGLPVNLVDTPYAASTAIENAPRIETWSLGCKLGALPFGFLRLSIEPTVYFRQGTAWVELGISAGVAGDTAATIAQTN